MAAAAVALSGCGSPALEARSIDVVPAPAAAAPPPAPVTTSTVPAPVVSAGRDPFASQVAATTTVPAAVPVDTAPPPSTTVPATTLPPSPDVASTTTTPTTVAPAAPPVTTPPAPPATVVPVTTAPGPAWYVPATWSALIAADRAVLQVVQAGAAQVGAAPAGTAAAQTAALAAFAATLPAGTPSSSPLEEGVTTLERAGQEFGSFVADAGGNALVAVTQGLRCTQDLAAGEQLLQQALVAAGIPVTALPLSTQG